MLIGDLHFLNIISGLFRKVLLKGLFEVGIRCIKIRQTVKLINSFSKSVKSCSFKKIRVYPVI
jgi:hypothetical protein